MKNILYVLSLASGLTACGDGRAQALHLVAPPANLQSANDFAICSKAWEQNELDSLPAERLGNPYLMFTDGSRNWQFDAEWQGRHFTVVPAAFYPFQVLLNPDMANSGSTSVVNCMVPNAWKALDTTISVNSDVKFHDSKKITMINGKPFGSQSKGGIYIRHNLIPGDLTDVNLAWFIQSPELVLSEAEQGIRSVLNLPTEQKLKVNKATELMQGQGSYPIVAVAMTVGTEAIEHWAVLPIDTAHLFPSLRFLPLGISPPAASVEAGWNAAKILDLAVFKLWDVHQARAVDCSTTAVAPKIACRQIVDEALFKVFDKAQKLRENVCMHLAWPGQDFGRIFVSSFCVNAENGTVAFQGTQRFDQLTGLEWAIEL